MEGVPSDLSGIVVRVVGRTAVTRTVVYVFVYGRAVGLLKDGRARTLPLEPGIHRVAVRAGFVRSGSYFVSLAPGEWVSFECGFKRRPMALPFAFMVAIGAALILTRFGHLGMAMAALGAALLLMLAILLVRIAMPGALFYLSRSGSPLGLMPETERMEAPAPKVRAWRERRGFQFSLRGLIVLIACCAPLMWVAREVWDRRPANQSARALRLLRSDDPGARLTGASYLHHLAVSRSLTPRQVDDAIYELVVALRDRRSAVRERAVGVLLWIVCERTQRSAPVPRVQDVAAGLAEGLVDSSPVVRHHSRQALTSIYFDPLITGKALSVLPADTGRFLELLGKALEDSDREIRKWAFQVLTAIGPRVKRAVPARLSAALRSEDSATRYLAIRTILAFPMSIDSSLPELMQILEHDPDPRVRAECFLALVRVRPSVNSLSLLRKALSSPKRYVRFRAADLISRIGPRASEAIPALLPLLQETFEPHTVYEREHPEWADPAVAATWALGAIAPGTKLAETARESLVELLRQPGHPWRRSEAEWALRRLDPASTRVSEGSRDRPVSVNGRSD